MLVEGEMLRNALKAHKEPPKPARVAEMAKAEPVVVQEPEAASEAVVESVVEAEAKLCQGELGI